MPPLYCNNFLMMGLAQCSQSIQLPLFIGMYLHQSTLQANGVLCHGLEIKAPAYRINEAIYIVDMGHNTPRRITLTYLNVYYIEVIDLF